jgi:hypothetical protein
MTRKNSIIFAVILFATLSGFVVFIGFVEFKDRNSGSVEDLLAKGADNSNSSLAGNSSLAANSSSGSNSASAAQAQAAQAQSPMVTSDTTSTAGTTSQDPSADTTSLNTDSSAPDTDSTTKTFSEDKMGISFDYPAEDSVSEKNSQITATKDGMKWEIKVYDNKDKKEIQDWFNGHYPTKDNAGCVLGDPTTLKLGSYTTKTLKASSTSVNCDDGGFFALNTDKSKVARVVLDKGTEDDANKILSTFKFLD